jgi:hypothetical protein
MSAEFLSTFLCHTSLSYPYLTVLSTFPSFFFACSPLSSDSLCKYRSKKPFRTKLKYRLCHDTRYFKDFPDVRLLCERPSKRTYSVNGCAMAQVVTRWPFTAATRVRSLVKSDTEQYGVPLSVWVQQCSVLIFKAVLNKGQTGEPWGPSNESNALPAMDDLQEREQSYWCRLHILAATVTADVDVLGPMCYWMM